jgi:hypothetical protein
VRSLKSFTQGSHVPPAFTGERGYLGDVRLARGRDRRIGIGLAKIAGEDSAAHGQIPYAAEREFLEAQQGIV